MPNQPTEAQLALSFMRRTGKWPTLESELVAERAHYVPVGAPPKPKGGAFRTIRKLERQVEQLQTAKPQPALPPIDVNLLSNEQLRKYNAFQGRSISEHAYGAPGGGDPLFEQKFAALKQQRHDEAIARNDARQREIDEASRFDPVKHRPNMDSATKEQRDAYEAQVAAHKAREESYQQRREALSKVDVSKLTDGQRAEYQDELRRLERLRTFDARHATDEQMNERMQRLGYAHHSSGHVRFEPVRVENHAAKLEQALTSGDPALVARATRARAEEISHEVMRSLQEGKQYDFSKLSKAERDAYVQTYRKPG